LTAILNYFPGGRWLFYGLAEAAPDWLGDSRGSYYTQVGLGVKVRPRPWVEIETLFTTFPAGNNSGAGQTYNLGFRFLR
jgi:hypothetical protein